MLLLCKMLRNFTSTISVLIQYGRKLKRRLFGDLNASAVPGRPPRLKVRRVRQVHELIHVGGSAVSRCTISIPADIYAVAFRVSVARTQRLECLGCLESPSREKSPGDTTQAERKTKRKGGKERDRDRDAAVHLIIFPNNAPPLTNYNKQSEYKKRTGVRRKRVVCVSGCSHKFAYIHTYVHTHTHTYMRRQTEHLYGAARLHRPARSCEETTGARNFVATEFR